MKKREKALREYLYTTPMILQYPNAFTGTLIHRYYPLMSAIHTYRTVTQPGHNLVQQGMPQIQSAMPVAPSNGFVAQLGPLAAPMGVPTGGDPSAAPAATTTANTAVVPPQMVPMGYPAAMDYSGYPDLRSAMASFFPRRSRRSQRHRSHRHRSRRRSPTPSDESSVTESMSTSYGSPSTYDSAEYPRNNYRRHRGPSQRERERDRDRDPYHHRSGSTHNPLPRPPKDILASTPFRPLLSQLPSTQYSTWGPASGGPQPPPGAPVVPMPQPQPAPPPQQSERRGLFRRRRDTRFAMPSLNAAAQSFNPPSAMSAMHMPIPDTQAAPPGRTPGPGMTPVLPPVVPGSAQMPMRMPEAEHQQQQQQQPPVIPHGMGPGSPNRMSMPSPGPAGSTPFVGGGGGLMTPSVVPGAVPSAGGPSMPMPNMGSAQAMPVSIGASPAVGAMPMPSSMGMGMPSPGGQGPVGLGGVVPTLRFNGYGEYSGLLYHSPHRVMYEDELFPTALHLFEALKFLPHRPDLAEQIRLCEHVEEVTAISASFAENTRRDWGNVALTTVRLFSVRPMCK